MGAVSLTSSELGTYLGGFFHEKDSKPQAEWFLALRVFYSEVLFEFNN